MKLLSTRVHGMIDYPMGVLLILLPFIGGFATDGAKQWSRSSWAWPSWARAC